MVYGLGVVGEEICCRESRVLMARKIFRGYLSDGLPTRRLCCTWRARVNEKKMAVLS